MKQVENRSSSLGRSHWLLVERLENWLLDEKRLFTEFGLPDRKMRMGSEIKKGDLLIFYVSDGISSLADIREAQLDGIAKLPFGGDYDTPYPWRVRTSPFLTLPRTRWVPFKPLLGSLTFTREHTDWRQIMRNSLRRLADVDALLILNVMKQASSASIKRKHHGPEFERRPS